MNVHYTSLVLSRHDLYNFVEYTVMSTLEEHVKRQWRMANYNPLTFDIDKKWLETKLKQIRARKKMQANF